MAGRGATRRTETAGLPRRRLSGRLPPVVGIQELQPRLDGASVRGVPPHLVQSASARSDVGRCERLQCDAAPGSEAPVDPLAPVAVEERHPGDAGPSRKRLPGTRPRNGTRCTTGSVPAARTCRTSHSAVSAPAARRASNAYPAAVVQDALGSRPREVAAVRRWRAGVFLLAALGLLGGPSWAAEGSDAELARLTAQRDAELARAAELKSQAADLRASLEAPPADDVAPVDVASFDAAEAGVETAAADVVEAEAGLALARDALAAASDEVERVGTGEKRRKRAEALVAARRAATEAAEAHVETSRLRLASAERAFASALERVRVVPDDLEVQRSSFDGREARLRRATERADLALREAEARWEKANSGPPGATPDERVAAARAELSLRQKAVALLGAELGRLAGEREAAERRLRIISESKPARPRALEWLEASRAALTELTRERGLDQADLHELEKERRSLQESETALAREARLRALDGRIAHHRSNQESLAAAIGAQERLIAAIERSTGERSWTDRLADLSSQARRVWNYPVGEAGDEVITVGKVAIALLLMVLGFLVARAFSHVLERRVLPRLGLDEGASHAFAELVFYALLVIVFLASLQSVSIPLTAFAVVGGALAIGVGFGSQNVVNNFISGIILLAERPIKIGDLVQVDETYGNIERIGLRSTRVRTGENIHVIVPNSAFLETKVINWTHHDTQVRVAVDVGVAYGSPTREVERRILAALDGVEGVLEHPAPFVLFTEFGDNALGFQVHFWARIPALMERRKIESRLRFRIDDEFREAGITIAFPQRDVHLDSLSPIEVRMVEGEREATE